jgi:starch phosphorylase
MENNIFKTFGKGLEGLSETLGLLYEKHLLSENLTFSERAEKRERYEAFASALRDIIALRWARTEETYRVENPKRIYYISMEFLIGRSLSNNITNMLYVPDVLKAAKDKGINWIELIEQEPEPGLGNGGLGRLAACFLDSMATLALPATGYGLRYEYGIFEQSIHDGWQDEKPANWLRFHDPWEISQPEDLVEITQNCSFELRDGSLRAVPGRHSKAIGIPFDRPVIGYGGKTVNTLRLWAAAASDYFDFREFSRGDFVEALTGTLTAESVTRVLYPDDSTSVGQGLRFVQEHFLVACSLADIIRRFRKSNADWNDLPSKVAIQMNDTHPAMAVLELMRILVDDAGLGWDQSWNITQKTLAYTNHTLLPEALEKWPVDYFEKMLPRHLEIAYEINRRLLESAYERFPGENQRIERISLFENRKMRMANLAIVGSHSINGVAAIHSELLRKTTVRDLADLYPERFNNKTNGVTQRRWLLMCNPHLAGIITDAIGPGWITDLNRLRDLKPLADDAGFREAFIRAKRSAKQDFTGWLKSSLGQTVDPESIFDSQVKRIHEYKRQLLNALRILIHYNRILENPQQQFYPRTFFFAGKAAPAYHLAKLIIKFINNLALSVDGDGRVNKLMKIVFIPEYCTSVAERLIPASDVSNQISTAGYEASGTSNMKFMMNGALTVGTWDGANIEMAEEAGEENFFMFGLKADQVSGSRGWYNPWWHYENDPEIRKALDMIFSDQFSKYEPGIFEPFRRTLLTGGDFYMHLADIKSFCDAHNKLGEIYAKQDEWSRMAILNIAASGKFSSDRTIAEYASEIWNVKPCPVT